MPHIVRTTDHYKVIDMDLAERLTVLRKHNGLTQQALADACGIHDSNIGGETGTYRLAPGAFAQLAYPLNTVASTRQCEPDERGPTDRDRRLRVGALAELDGGELHTVRGLNEGARLCRRPDRLAG